MLRSLEGSAPVVNARPVRTRDYAVEIQRSGPAALPAIYRHLHIVSVFLGDGTTVVRENASGSTRTRYTRGDSSLHAAGPGESVRWPTGVHGLHVHLHPRLVREVGAATLRTPLVSLEVRPRLRDPVIREIGLEVYELVGGRGPVDAGDVHDLIMALTHHLVAAYATTASPPSFVGGMTVEKVLDAFREDVATWDGVASLARRAGLTRSHFARRIRELTGLPPYQRVVGSRIEAAKHLLERTETPISGVAYRTGFADQSHLTRAFRRATGSTPARYRAARS